MSTGEKSPHSFYDEVPYEPVFASTVLALYTVCMWSILYSFQFLVPSFLSAGPGRSATPLDTAAGQLAVAADILGCELAIINALDLTACKTTLANDLILVTSQPTTPLLMFVGAVIDTWPKWAFLAFVAFSNYAVSYYGIITVQNWNQMEVQDTSKKMLSHDLGTVLYIRIIWIVFEFFIYMVDIYIAQMQIDLMAFSITGYVVITLIMVPRYVTFKTSLAIHPDQGYTWVINDSAMPMPYTVMNLNDARNII